jgi:hypothetical protein
VGNHEVWGDPKIEGTLSAVPYLKNLGITTERLIYKFDFKGSRFIFLWTGKYTGYPEDLCWRGAPPRQEYNYVLVDVEPNEKTKFSLTRYRPDSAEPFATHALFT